MKQNNDYYKSIILEALHGIPDKLSIRDNILHPLGHKLELPNIEILKKQLIKEGLIMEVEPGSKLTKVEITKEGYDAIEFYGNYAAYKKEQGKLFKSRKNLEYLNEKNVRLNNINIIVGIISFIAGILLSDPIKNLLKSWLLTG